MFTGLVEATGALKRRAGKPVTRAFIEVLAEGKGPSFADPFVLGESISVNGACLTVDAIEAGGFGCDMSAETLDRTTLGALAIGARVHLERATALGARMGGHVVLGHVDAVGRVTARVPSGSAVRLSIAAPEAIAGFVAGKGSIAIDGVSLTVNEVRDEAGGATFDVMLVPHTIARTLLGELRPGAQVNLEVDVLARYVARQLARRPAEVGPTESDHDGTNSDQRLYDKLRSSGFL